MLARCLAVFSVSSRAGGLCNPSCWHLQRTFISVQDASTCSNTSKPVSRMLAALAQRVSLSEAELQPCFRAVLVDAAGTFLMPSEPVSTVYLRYARPYGCQLSDGEVLQRFRRAYNMPWPSPLRYVGDARPFWRRIVEHSTGCDLLEVSEAIYQYYSRAEAWCITPGAVGALQRLRSAGVLLGVVSNFDTRLRPLLRHMGVDHLFDAVIVSAEVSAEKPNPVIFDEAVRKLSAAAVTRGTVSISPFHYSPSAAAASAAAGSSPAVLAPQPVGLLGSSSGPAFSDYGPLVPGHVRSGGANGGTAVVPFIPDFGPLAPEQVVHVGDDRRNDCWGARDAGITAWHWGYDVRSWDEVADRVLLGSQADEFYEH